MQHIFPNCINEICPTCLSSFQDGATSCPVNTISQDWLMSSGFVHLFSNTCLNPLLFWAFRPTRCSAILKSSEISDKRLHRPQTLPEATSLNVSSMFLRSINLFIPTREKWSDKVIRSRIRNPLMSRRGGNLWNLFDTRSLGTVITIISCSVTLMKNILKQDHSNIFNTFFSICVHVLCQTK